VLHRDPAWLICYPPSLPQANKVLQSRVVARVRRAMAQALTEEEFEIAAAFLENDGMSERAARTLTRMTWSMEDEQKSLPSWDPFVRRTYFACL
jgi:hypothetical protein